MELVISFSYLPSSDVGVLQTIMCLQRGRTSRPFRPPSLKASVKLRVPSWSPHTNWGPPSAPGLRVMRTREGEPGLAQPDAISVDLSAVFFWLFGLFKQFGRRGERVWRETRTHEDHKCGSRTIRCVILLPSKHAEKATPLSPSTALPEAENARFQWGTECPRAASASRAGGQATEAEGRPGREEVRC